jgi:hypothetical protein
MKNTTASRSLIVAFLLLGCGPKVTSSYSGTVVESVGLSRGPAVAQPCVVSVRPLSGPTLLNCRISVLCGTAALYGGARIGGYTTCGSKDGVATGGEDPETSAEDGDPVVRLDVAKGLLEVSDSKPDWHVTVKLDQPL